MGKCFCRRCETKLHLSLSWDADDKLICLVAIRRGFLWFVFSEYSFWFVWVFLFEEINRSRLFTLQKRGTINFFSSRWYEVCHWKDQILWWLCYRLPNVNDNLLDLLRKLYSNVCKDFLWLSNTTYIFKIRITIWNYRLVHKFDVLVFVLIEVKICIDIILFRIIFNPNESGFKFYPICYVLSNKQNLRSRFFKDLWISLNRRLKTIVIKTSISLFYHINVFNVYLNFITKNI